MRIRNRLVGLLIGVLSLGAAVAMFPSGGAAAGGGQAAPTASAKPAPPPSTNATCETAKRWAATEMKLVGKYLDASRKTQYQAALNRAVDAACNGTLTCQLAQDVLAELRSIRAGLLPSNLEVTLQGLEDGLMRLICSS